MANGISKSTSVARHAKHLTPGSKQSGLSRVPAKRRCIFSEDAFREVLTLERRRADRSRRPFILMLVDAQAAKRQGIDSNFNDRLTWTVSAATRETDVIGWYKDGLILGVIFTELKSSGEVSASELVRAKIERALDENLDPEVKSRLIVSVHLFPESWDAHRPDRLADIKIYPELLPKSSNEQLTISIKRVIDVSGSVLLLLLFSPVLAMIALAIKLTSKGPVIFAQDRLGQFGTTFRCFKFRTMYSDSDPQLHRDYVRSFIAGKSEKEAKEDKEEAVYKITNDPRVTPVGKLLRKLSLDEFPQFWNVLRGEMSLVGPRPALPYEFDDYDYWHRRRVLYMKPGVTGLWQVSGRSRVSFNDMVRLDLRYSQGWSLWLDFKILMATPMAVLLGKGAF